MKKFITFFLIQTMLFFNNTYASTDLTRPYVRNLYFTNSDISLHFGTDFEMVIVFNEPVTIYNQNGIYITDGNDKVYADITSYNLDNTEYLASFSNIDDTFAHNTGINICILENAFIDYSSNLSKPLNESYIGNLDSLPPSITMDITDNRNDLNSGVINITTDEEGTFYYGLSKQINENYLELDNFTLSSADIKSISFDIPFDNDNYIFYILSTDYLNNVSPYSTYTFIEYINPILNSASILNNIVYDDFYIDFSFSEQLNSLTSENFIIENGNITDIQTSDDINYRVYIDPINFGLVNISFNNENLPTDLNGNTLTKVNDTITITYEDPTIYPEYSFKDFEIFESPIEMFTMKISRDVPYTFGLFNITVDDIQLVENEDYTVSYENLLYAVSFTSPLDFINSKVTVTFIDTNSSSFYVMSKNGVLVSPLDIGSNGGYVDVSILDNKILSSEIITSDELIVNKIDDFNFSIYVPENELNEIVTYNIEVILNYPTFSKSYLYDINIEENDITEPDITEPDITEPDVTEPDVTEPDITEPDVTEPDVTEPDVTEPDVTEPDVTEPDITEPDVTEPDVTEPDVKNVILNEDNNTAYVTLDNNENSIHISEELLTSANKNDIETIEFKSNYASYSLPTNILQTSTEIDDILQSNNLDQEDVKLVINISPVDSVELIKSKFDENSENISLLSTPVDFTINITNNNEEIGTLSNFSEPISRTLYIDENVESMPQYWSAIKINEDTGSASYVPHSLIELPEQIAVNINSYTNSIYAVVENDIDFIDLNNNHWAYEYIKTATSKFLLSGTSQNEFSPNKEVTRAEFIQTLNNAVYLPSDNKKIINDINEDDWYYSSAMNVYNNNLINHLVVDNNLNADLFITRLEVATSIANLLDNLNYNDIDSNIHFEDINHLDKNSIEDIKLVASYEIMQGTGNNKFSPDKTLTRAELSTLILKLVEVIY